LSDGPLILGESVLVMASLGIHLKYDEEHVVGRVARDAFLVFLGSLVTIACMELTR